MWSRSGRSRRRTGWPASGWKQVVGERDRVTAALREQGYEVPPSQANFVWLPLKDRAADFAAHCESRKVIVRAFADATGGVRVTIGSPEENDVFLTASVSYTHLRAHETVLDLV